MVKVRYAALPVEAATEQELQAAFEIVTAYGHGEGEDYTQTHWLIEDRNLCDKMFKIGLMGGLCSASVEVLNNHIKMIK